MAKRNKADRWTSQRRNTAVLLTVEKKYRLVWYRLWHVKSPPVIPLPLTCSPSHVFQAAASGLVFTEMWHPSEWCSVLNLSFPPFWHMSAFDVFIFWSSPICENNFPSLLSVTFIAVWSAHTTVEPGHASSASSSVGHSLERSTGMVKR